MPKEINTRPFKCDLCDSIKPPSEDRHQIDLDEEGKCDLCTDCAFMLLGALIRLCDVEILAQLLKDMKKNMTERMEQCTKPTDPNS